MPLFKLAIIIGWGVIQLSVEGVKAYNLNKQLKLKEKEKKKDEKLTK